MNQHFHDLKKSSFPPALSCASWATVLLLGSRKTYYYNGLGTLLEYGVAWREGSWRRLRRIPLELGMLVYRLYRALTYGASPLIHLHMRWRRLRGVMTTTTVSAMYKESKIEKFEAFFFVIWFVSILFVELDVSVVQGWWKVERS